MILTDIKTHFSAFGVAVLTGLIIYIFFPKAEEPNKTEQTMVAAPSAVQPGGELVADNIVKIKKKGHTTQLPSEIMDKFEAIIEPLQRDEAAQNYVGFEVEWNLYFKGIQERGDDTVRVIFADSKDLPANTFVSCVVSLNENTTLKTIQKNSVMNVSGLISKIALKSASIELENTILKMPGK